MRNEDHLHRGIKFNLVGIDLDEIADHVEPGLFVKLDLRHDIRHFRDRRRMNRMGDHGPR